MTARGATVIAVAPAALSQAASLQAKLPFQLYLDEKQQIRDLLELHRPSLLEWITDLSAWWRYLKALARHRRQYRVTGHFSNVPAIAIIDRQGTISYLYRGRGIGDYPTLSEILTQLRST